MQDRVSQTKPICPGFAGGSAGEELAAPENTPGLKPLALNPLNEPLRAGSAGRELSHSSNCAGVARFLPHRGAVRCQKGLHLSCLCPQGPGDFSPRSWPYLCATHNSSLLLFRLSPPSFLGKGAEGFWLSPEALQSCCSPEAAHRRAQKARSLGTRVGFLQLFHSAYIALGFFFFTGSSFPNRYFPFSPVLSLFHPHRLTWIKVIQNRRLLL